MDQLYCNSLTRYERFKTREVKIGGLLLGGDNPIRLQSMTTTDTMDTPGSIDQSIRMIEAGCELVRLTAPSKKDAENLRLIQDGIRSKGYDTPLVADIHFTPNAAEIAAGIVDKVRVNPGNYADKKKFEEIEYSDESYQAELERIRKRFTPLVELCKQNGTAMRIGTNHGSLSDRIMSRYGDTPVGMVESAMEFIRICNDLDYHNLVISMKASNPQVMVQAYRLLVATMLKEGYRYPLHLGVTEAGEGEDGRIKSAVGIGTLLEDGLGDTIRVSLTEEPEAEIPVAKMLADRYQKRAGHNLISDYDKLPYSPYGYTRRHTAEVLNIGAKHSPVVVADLSSKQNITPASFFAFGYAYSVPLDKWNLQDQSADYVYLGDNGFDFEIPGTLGVIINQAIWKTDYQDRERVYPYYTAEDYRYSAEVHSTLNFVEVNMHDVTSDLMDHLGEQNNVVLVLVTDNVHGMAEQRRIFIELMNKGIDNPVVIRRTYQDVSEEQLPLFSGTDFGALLLDGMGDGIWFSAPQMPQKLINRTAFGILQATRTRISKTEYISCPSCGRTLFDLQETTAKIRSRTDHLKGVKIGIMGCIVNGPGEMADADYGYVGTGPGKITLYKEKTVVQRNIPESEAVEALIGLIKEYGDWVDAPATA